MRFYIEDTITAKKPDNQKDVENGYTQLSQDLVFFNVRLRALEEILASCKPDEALRALQDYKTLQNFIDTLKNYLAEIETKKTLCFKRNKLNDEDMRVLKAQAAGIHKMREQLCDSKTSSDKLSKLIDDAAQMEYSVSCKKAWLRRGITVLGGLIAVVATVAIVTLLMTPGINVLAAVVMVPIMLKAALAFFYLRRPETINTSVNLGPVIPPLQISTPVPSTLGVAGAGIAGVSLFRKLRTTNPKKEEAARMSSVGMMNQATDQLRIKIEALSDKTVKDFLLSVVNQADKMHNTGSQSWFYETRVSKMQKARLILRETAKLLEVGTAPESVKAILETEIAGTNYKFAQLLNAQRNPSFFSNRKSNFIKAVFTNTADMGNKAVSLKAIAAVAP